jgi:hypothetical protein
MHDIDRTQLETWETGYEADSYEFEGESTFEGPFSEVEEMELASELLEITSEEELDQFLGSLFKKASRAVGSFLKNPLVGQLKGMLKKALPIAGSALGSVVPGLGTMLGGAGGAALANAFELELEGLSAEDQEFEVARRYVRLAGEVAQQAAQAPQNIPPEQIAKQAMMTAAQQHAPGLLRQSAPPAAGTGRRARSGRWVREGRTIILLGV